jgi:hypothetical protein
MGKTEMKAYMTFESPQLAQILVALGSSQDELVKSLGAISPTTRLFVQTWINQNTGVGVEIGFPSTWRYAEWKWSTHENQTFRAVEATLREIRHEYAKA